MKSIQQKAADIAIELHSAILDVTDYRELPAVIESTVKKQFHIDWLAMFAFGTGNDIYNVVTNDSLPFDWNEKYAEIYAFDTFRIHSLRMPVGSSVTFDEIRDPYNEGENFVLEFVKKHTDTSHFLGLHSAKTEHFDSGVGLYRTDAKFPFTPDEKRVLDFVGPVLVQITHMMHLYSAFDLQRVAIEELRRHQRGVTVMLDHKLSVIDYPPETEHLLSRHFPVSRQNPLPLPIEAWVRRVIAPCGRLGTNTGPWHARLETNETDLHVTARVVVTEMRRRVLLLTIVPLGGPVDFSKLRGVGLTPREIDALSYLTLGLSNRQIAMAMGIREVTAKKHLRSVADKLDASGRTETLFRAIQTNEMMELV